MSEQTLAPLSEELKQEFGCLLLLDRMMQYESLARELESLQTTVTDLEAELKQRKKGFFHSDEEDMAIEETKADLNEARQAVQQVESEIKEQETHRLHISLSEQSESGLEPLVQQMEQRGWLEMGDDNYYHPTDKGSQAYDHLLDQQQSYIAHFDVYAFVDLEEGVFADPDTDLLEDQRWTDLRVAVAEHKGIDPYRVVFLSMLSSEAFFENPDWKFDLSVGTLFDEMGELTQQQLLVDQLGYEDEEGEVSGAEVIQDVIEQGSEIAQERIRRQEQEAREREIAFQTPDEQIITTTYYW
ncbi:MAG: hypothetical protein ACO4AU_05980 [bacterium]|jgi:DNA-binding PadR family transcriptional regulator